MSTLTMEPVIEQTAVVGDSVGRIDGVAKVTGRIKFTKDLSLRHMLYGKIIRSPFPHARILNIDLTRAIAINGVQTAITGKEFPALESEDTPPLARDEVLYSGQGVAAVAAVSPELVELAAEAINVEYEPLPALLDPEESLSGGNGVVIRHPNDDPKSPNVGRHLKMKLGDVEEAFTRSDHIVENRFTTALEAHSQIEPLTFMAKPELDGGITIWATSSGPHKVRYELARYLSMDHHKIRAIVTFLGGWFGSKEENHISAVCAKLALKSENTVKIELTREESMIASGARHPAIIYVKDGIKDDKIIARAIKAIFDGGAYSSLGNTVLRGALLVASSVYKIPNCRFDAYRVYTNRVPGTPKRGPMSLQTSFAIESQMDNVANLIGVDPVELRMSHLMENGETSLIGEKMDTISHKESLKMVAQAFGTNTTPKYPWKLGKGIALGAKQTTGGPWQAMVRMREDGSVEVFAAAIENGQGTYTAISQIVAQEFGIPIEKVRLMSFNEGADSSTSGPAAGASASRQIANLGKAVLLACRDAKRIASGTGSEVLGVPADEIDIRGGKMFVRSDAHRSIDIARLFTTLAMFGKLSKTSFMEGPELVGFGTVAKRVAEFNPKTGQLSEGRASPYYVTVAQAAEVAVNVENGQVNVLKVTAAMDVGKAINPKLVSCQIEGAVSMALSATLGEEMVVSEGKIVNANFADYKIIGSIDAAKVNSIILETAYADGPFGAKGAGEGSMLPTAPAIRNAIHDATGVWINSLPITRERVLDALRNKDCN